MSGEKILLIDDSRLSRTMFKNALGPEYTYLEAVDGISGLETYFLEQPDLVILDLTMPGMNGLDVLAQILAINPQAKVIVGTADVQEFSRRQTEELGACAFLLKPFSAQTVQETVQKALEKGFAA